MKDSGERREFSSGAVRDRGKGKPKPGLIPSFALLRIGTVYAKGGDKYNDRNWEKGMPQSEFLESLERHILKYKCGLIDEDHLGQAAFNLLALIDQEERMRLNLLPWSLDDLPHYCANLPEVDTDSWLADLEYEVTAGQLSQACHGSCECVHTETAQPHSVELSLDPHVLADPESS